jgi:D-2-hydroxyacid dehydrogenase (NADP+)
MEPVRPRANRRLDALGDTLHCRTALRATARMPTSATASPHTLLLSAHALRVWGPRIVAAGPAGAIAFRTAEEAGATVAPCDADIAFMTREVTGASTKNKPTSELANFEAVLRRSPRLRWLQIHPAGAERPLYRELRQRGVKVTTASGATAITVAHSTLGALIALNRRFPLLANAQRRHAWEPRLGERSPRDLAGQTAVIVGLGPIGQNIARLLKALGLSVIGMRRSAGAVEPCDRTVTYEQIRDVLPLADWLILCCPASPLTRGLANATAFAAMPEGACFINVARGECAVEADVIAALRSGKLAGAYLDVFEREPLDPASPLWEMPNVIVSPHTASHSLGQNEAIFAIFLDNLTRWRDGCDLRNDVDRME